MLPIVERKCHNWMLLLLERNFCQVGMPPLVERNCHHWILPLVAIHVHQGIPLVESGDQNLPLVESGDQGQMDPSKHF